MEIIISILALIISAITAWLAIMHRGTVKITRPHFFALLPENSPFGGQIKLFMRVLVFSTSQRGRVIESMTVTLKCEGKSFPLNYWMYGEANKLTIGSGVFVGHEGISVNHHFVPTNALSANDFISGHYIADIYAHLLGDNSPIKLFKLEFELSENEISTIRTSNDKAIYFTWDQELNKYKSHIDSRPSQGRVFSVSGSGAGPFPWE